MKGLRTIIQKYKLWLAALLAFNILYGYLLWLTGEEGFLRLIPAILLGSLGIYFLIGFMAGRFEEKKAKAMMDFLEQPETDMEEAALAYCFDGERQLVLMTGALLRENREKIMKQETGIREYEEYIEAWAHEIKTPLALMTFILDNRRDELAPAVYHRLEYARTKMQEDVERMLYYARLKSANTDYLFERLSLRQICSEIIGEYEILLEEQQIIAENNVADVQVVADRKGLDFCIRQVVSNAIKYMRPEKDNRRIWFTSGRNEGSGDIFLAVRDNGTGVGAYDLPFIFDKGFTGDKGTTGKGATGMGLYLARQVAGHMKVDMTVYEAYRDGFEIRFIFPEVR